MLKLILRNEKLTLHRKGQRKINCPAKNSIQISVDLITQKVMWPRYLKMQV